MRRGRVRIGLGIGVDGVRAVAVRPDGRPLWAIEAELEAGESLGNALAELLAGVPARGRWPRPIVTAAVGPSAAQVKRLGGLPPVAHDGTLAAIVAQGAGRFFLKNGIPLVTTGVRPADDGELWAGAIEAPVVEAIAHACRAARLPLAGIVPTVVALGDALDGDRHVWPDGEIQSEVATAGGRLVSVRRRPQVGRLDAAPPTSRPVAALAALGEGAWRFADAYGAAVSAPTQPLAYRPSRRGGATGDDARVPGWRLALAAGALTVAALVALALPGLEAERAARDATTRLAALAPARHNALAAERELARLTRAMGEVAAFDAGRRPMTFLLRDLTAGLPDGTALVTLRVDSAAGTLVALGPRAAAAISALERVPGIVAPEIVGPVTREVIAGLPGAAPPSGTREVERVTVRFRLAPVTPSPTPAPRRGGP